jgi:predicted dehydrogenase
MSAGLQFKEVLTAPRAPSAGKVKLAVVGCGAAAKILHLPAIARSERVVAAVLVDQSPERAGKLGLKYAVPAVLEDYRKIGDRADAAIVALPNHLHGPVTIDLLRQGIHVLVEKPMALNTSDCDAMTQAAEASGATLAVGMEFRFFSSSRFVKQLVREGWIGRVTGFDLRLGIIFDWPVESDHLLHKSESGGGVLMDFGVHVLDLLLWWLGDYRSVIYFDDAAGGVESNCELHLEMQAGARGVVELSRTRNLRNTCVLRGERGVLEVSLWTPEVDIHLKSRDDRTVLSGRISRGDGASTLVDAFQNEIEDFAEAIRASREPFVPGHEARRAIGLVDDCYAGRRPLRQPWCPESLFS